MKLYERDDAEGKLRIDVNAIADGAVEVFFHDIGTAAKRMTGDLDYERALKIPAEQVAGLAVHLLADRFAGDAQAQSKIEAYCKERGIETNAWSF